MPTEIKQGDESRDVSPISGHLHKKPSFEQPKKREMTQKVPQKMPLQSDLTN
jgi:hypothetical protein